MTIRSKFYMQKNEYDSIKMHGFSLKRDLLNHEIRVRVGYHQEKLPNIEGHMYLIEFREYLRIIQIVLLIASIVILVLSFVFKQPILCVALVPVLIVSRIIVHNTFKIKQIYKIKNDYVEL